MKHFKGMVNTGRTYKHRAGSVPILRELFFKWQWAVSYESKDWSMGRWNHKFVICDSRSDARAYTANIKGQPKFYRKIQLKRRLVQAHWDVYNDSFSYNAKGNGNGR